MNIETIKDMPLHEVQRQAAAWGHEKAAAYRHMGAHDGTHEAVADSDLPGAQEMRDAIAAHRAKWRARINELDALIAAAHQRMQAA